MASPGNVSLLFLEGFNNYYNRIVKKFDTLNEYISQDINKIDRSNVNFNPSDGVNTICEITYNETDLILSPDYVVVFSGNDILSRWFVIDEERLRGNQYRYTLRRDVISDNYESVISAPSFIEKATVREGDSALYNSENIEFNQIKTEEHLLKDESGIPWIVGYYTVPKDGDEDDVVTTTTVPPTYISRSEWMDEYGDFTTNVSYGLPNKIVIAYNGHVRLTGSPSSTLPKCSVTQYSLKPTSLYGTDGGHWTVNDPNKITTGNSTITTPYRYEDYNGIKAVFFKNYEYLEKTLTDSLNQSSIKTALINNINSFYNYYAPDTLSEVRNQVGKILKDSNNKYYKVELDTENSKEVILTPSHDHSFVGLNGHTYYTITSNSSLDPIFTQYLPSPWQNNESASNPSNRYSYEVHCSSIKLKLVEITGETITTTISPNRRKLSDAPYCMFCIPYGDGIVESPTGTLWHIRKNASIAIAQAIASQLSAKLYDLQLVPYCPIRSYLYDKDDDHFAKIPVSALRNYDYAWVVPPNAEIPDSVVRSVILWSTVSSGEFSLPFSIPIGVEPKVQLLTDKYRLCSPNYSGSFEFNPVRNGGVTEFNVDFTYKPYQPYIHINPDFGALYGHDFNDARGLICGGDYSLSRIEDKFATYELQNKNYQLAFDRQIEHIEVNNAYQREQDIFGIAGGAIGGAVSGAIGGSKFGPAGALVGGLAGGALSAGAGLYDLKRKDELREEAIDYTKDQFGYQLGNIKALPYTLNKVGALNANNKLFPFLEKYTCTDEEKQALRDKIKYNGMTVMRIGTIYQFLQDEPSYIKCKLIRLEDAPIDNHMLNAIADELNKGVFI